MLELWPHARYIWRTALSDVRHRYAGASAGVLWNVLQPLSMILVYSLVFATIMDRESNGDAPYVVYLCTAMLPWIAFSETVNRGSNAIRANAQYLRKLPIPESAFVAQAVLSSAITLAISYAILAVAAIPFGFIPNAYWLLAPLPFALLLLLAFGVAALGAAVVPFVSDVSEIIKIMYTPGILPEGVAAILPYNPAYPALQAGRQMMLEARMPDWWLMPAALGWGVLFTTLGLLALKAVRSEIRDVI
jgi:ABC-type polysaccharide/polyol phosphate export permease